MKTVLMKRKGQLFAIALSTMIAIQGMFVSVIPVRAAATPCDPKATDSAKLLMEYLSTHTYVSGQTDVKDAEKVKNMTGRYPAMVAFDFYRYTDGDTSETQKAIDWAKNTGGIIAFQWHWKSPGGGEFYTNYDFTNGAMNDANSKLRKDIDLVVSEIKKNWGCWVSCFVSSAS
jgi:hypothetical protein